MSTGVHQVIAGASSRDAITNHVMAAQRVIRGMGLRSDVFVDEAHMALDMHGLVHPHGEWDAIARPGDLAILHYSIDSPAFEHVMGRAARTAVHYHNVTPPELLWRSAPALAPQCRDGRAHLGRFAGRVACSAADSSFNAREMEQAGLPPADVIGILRQDLAIAPGRGRVRNARPRILFVGRGVPNKCQHDLILAVGALAETGVDVELRLVGSWGANRPYLERCRRLIRSLDVGDNVIILDSLDNGELAGEYARADLFACMSEHEGYCVPLLEAMTTGLPIIAFAAGAVPETLGDAGLLIDDKSPSVVAEAVLAVLDGALADRMAAGRRTQSARHSAEATTERLARFIRGFAGC